MLKRDLLALIAHLPDDADIRMDEPTGDYWRRHLASDFETVEAVLVRPSAYYDGRDVIVEDDGDDDDGPQGIATVYVLS